MASVKLDCIGDAAYIGQATAQATAIVVEASLQAALQVAMLAATRYTKSAIADMEEELASRRVRLAEVALAHAKLTWAKEKAFVSETMAEGSHSANYGSTAIVLNAVDREEGLAVEGLDTRLSRMGIPLGPCDESRTSRGIATARTDLVSHTMRAAEARAIALNDRRYSRQLAAVGMGRGTLQDALNMGQLSAGATAVRDSLLNTINSGMSLWGYSANRWQHGRNYISGENGTPRVIPNGYTMVNTTDVNGSRTMVLNDSLADALTSATTSTSEYTPSSSGPLRESSDSIDMRDN